MSRVPCAAATSAACLPPPSATSGWNRLLQSVAETEDFEELPLDLGALPTVPPYWARMRKANVEGPAPLGVRTDPPALQVEAFARGAGATEHSFKNIDGDSRFRIRRFLLSKGDCRHIWQRFDSLETCLSQSNDDRKWPKGFERVLVPHSPVTRKIPVGTGSLGEGVVQHRLARWHADFHITSCGIARNTSSEPTSPKRRLNMTTEKQLTAARKNIRKAQAAWQSMSSRQHAMSPTRRPGAEEARHRRRGNYYHVESGARRTS